MGKKKGGARGAPRQQPTREEMLAAAQQQAMYMNPNPNTVYLWPSTEECEDFKRFVCVWPAFINSDLTIPKGRRIAKEKACPDPLVQEMSEVCQHYRLPHAIEPYKAYGRQPGYPGRIRVRLRNDAGELIDEEIATRRDLMVKMGELIPKLKSRQVRLSRAAQQAQAMREAAMAKPAQPAKEAKPAKAAPVKKKKKKGKR